MTVSAGHPLVNITGEQVLLGPLRRDLLWLYHRWLNDYRMQRTLGDLPVPLTYEPIEAQYDRDWFREDQVRFLIDERASLRPVGMTLMALDRRSPADGRLRGLHR